MKRRKRESGDDDRAAIDPLSDAFDITRWPFYHMARLVGLYHLRMDAVLKPVGMDVPRWRVLMILADRPCATITEISGEAVTKMSTMAKIIQRMVAQDLVETRTSADDARSTEVLITPDGRVVLDRIKAKVSWLSKQAFADVSDEDLQRLNAVAGRIYGNLSP